MADSEVEGASEYVQDAGMAALVREPDAAADTLEDMTRDRPRAGGPESDPLAALMLRAVLALLLVLLVGAGSLIVYLLSVRGAPRTQLEQDIIAFEMAVKEQPGEVVNWTELAKAYAASRRYSDAMRTLKEARRRHEDEASVYTTEADVLRMAGKAAEALKAYETAEKVAVTQFSKLLKSERDRGIDFERPNPYLGEVYLGRALAQLDLDRPKEALRSLEVAKKYDPFNSSLLTRMGDTLMELGRPQDAEASYTEALEYVPDYAPALEGLQRIREGD